MTAVTSPFGGMLRDHRRRSKLSQLNLAVHAGVSQRHLSFLESGRSQPSRDMVVQLAEALDLPLTHCNDLLTAAGFAELYPRRRLDATAMAPIRSVLDRMLAAQEPFPALVMDRAWNVLLANRGLIRLLDLVGGMEALVARVGGPNLLRLTLHPEGLRPHIRNWEEIAAYELTRASREPSGHAALEAVLEEVRGYPGLPRPGQTRAPLLPVLPTVFGLGDQELRLITTIAGFGTPQDVTADELRVEYMFPADEASEALLRQLEG
jgi:transcriptional regulator with XRE-family HTH domain